MIEIRPGQPNELPAEITHGVLAELLLEDCIPRLLARAEAPTVLLAPIELTQRPPLLPPEVGPAQ